MSTITEIQEGVMMHRDLHNNARMIPDKFILAVAAGQPYCRKNREEEQWDYPGNKVRFHREQSGDFLCPNRCP
jgi:hypothetical protein